MSSLQSLVLFLVDEDFDELNRRMVEFAPNVFRETLDIGITNDLIHEISEDFTVGLTLEDQGSGVQLTDSTATVTITNEDSECSILFLGEFEVH